MWSSINFNSGLGIPASKLTVDVLNFQKKHTHISIIYIFPHSGWDQTIEILPRVSQDATILHIQYHGCLCPADTRNQGISNRDIDYGVTE